MGSLKSDLTGRKYGRLLVIGISEKRSKSTKWICKCDCGKEKAVIDYNLKSGHTKSCGCLRRETAKLSNTTHGLSKTRFYQCWRDMIDRTTREENSAYENYGGRGISVCEKWKIFEGFMNDMHESYLAYAEANGEQNTTIDRIDPNGNYYFDNCRWATPKVQSLNRRNNKKYMVDGELLTAKEISEKYCISYSAVIHRINRGWSSEELKLPTGGARSGT
ncbi:hypothetical protein MKX34_26575 [Paenibacillus sp. FSL R5-0636]|uniref:hypothetical protein n=1 Tax=Paenibacillus TaxID=44249 RepID=UPI00096D6F20|nr:hypothetical protein [Paenibacillus odorifer]OMC99153.1 hypothetical protein BJP49_29955 [Paenibacillus odorifer]